MNPTTVEIRCQSPELAKFLAQLGQLTRETYDISPEVLTQILNDPQLERDGLFLQSQYQLEMFRLIDNFKQEFFTVMEQSSGGNIAVKDSEYEKCGMIKKIYSNGFIECCNHHKYLHSDEEHSPLSHPFVTKDHNQIIKETYQVSVYIYYQNYVNQVLNGLKLLMDNLITSRTTMETIRLDKLNLSSSSSSTTPSDSTTSSNSSNSTTSNPLTFRRKGIFKHINLKEDHDPERDFYYVKSYTLVESN
jgi:hypothetical protein